MLSGEFGHLAIDPNGPVCYCGARGCLEMLAAAPAIVTAAQDAPPDSHIRGLAEQHREGITARMVCQAAELGDPFATQVIAEAATSLGIGIANLLNLLTPEIVVMGGGVTQSWPLFRPTIEATVSARSGMLKAVSIKIVPDALGLNAGITGAAFSVFSEMG